MFVINKMITYFLLKMLLMKKQIFILPNQQTPCNALQANNKLQIIRMCPLYTKVNKRESFLIKDGLELIRVQ